VFELRDASTEEIIDDFKLANASFQLRVLSQ
jgi:hypothetical protein